MINNKELIERQKYLFGFIQAGRASELSITTATEELAYEIAPQLATALEQAETENEQLKESVREAKEIFTGMDGFKPETAPEAYQQRVLRQMYEALKGGML